MHYTIIMHVHTFHSQVSDSPALYEDVDLVIRKKIL